MNLYAALRDRYRQPEWAFLEEVRSHTGTYGDTRYADAIAIGCYPSRGQYIHGLEIKASRSDWLAELKNPAKADTIFKFCDYWWLVVTDKAIVQDDLPTNWGLLAMCNGKLRVVKQAPKLSPEPPSIAFLASVMRNVVQRYVPSDSIGERIEEARKAGVAQGQHYGEVDVQRLTQERDYWKQRVDAFEKAAGIGLDTSSIPTLVTAYRLASCGVSERYLGDLEDLKLRASNIANIIGAHIREAEALRKETGR